MNLTILLFVSTFFFSHLLVLLMHLIVGDNYKVAGFLSLALVDSITQAADVCPTHEHQMQR